MSPKHRLIKVDSQEFGRCKVPLSPVTVQEEPVRTVCVLLNLPFSIPPLFSPSFALSLSHLLARLLSHTTVIFQLPFCEMLFVPLSPPRSFPLPQQRWTPTQTTLIHLMSVQTREADQIGSPNLHQQIAAATWSHLRLSGLSQVCS